MDIKLHLMQTVIVSLIRLQMLSTSVTYNGRKILSVSILSMKIDEMSMFDVD